ncbi:hypothetical protein MGYG_05009 [Nannizzia gypsea CBS 118893]|uniref:Uncharacterized protein n=1 Tax=Arthroderma gypseum (strain ATCC MYA-4604 / CBS 118893) TaxID=535722 RepID=E4UY13_ARTGP|nr:hypothetical protein MGYG_05009 [Nannizzia gypsea CBS 118893]EFR02006.1 hypothetical protein MGYG_05009 [Nannizzia gypsea CBS 118893]
MAASSLSSMPGLPTTSPPQGFPTPGTSPTSSTSPSTTSPSTTSPSSSTSPSTTSPSTTSPSSTPPIGSGQIPGSSNGTDTSTGSATLTPSRYPTASARPSQLPASSSGYSDGVLAGAIVASTIGSAILTCLVAYFCFYRNSSKRGAGPKNKRTQSDNHDTEVNGYRNHLSGALTLPSTQHKSDTLFSRTLHDDKSNLGSYIPNSADDQAVRSRVLTAFEQIALHVENYYSYNSSLNAEPSYLTQDSETIGPYNSPFLPAPAISMLAQSKDKVPVIKHCLIQTILPLVFHTTQYKHHSNEESLLPPLYAAFTFLGELQSYQDVAASQVQFHWRMLSAYGYRGVSATQKQAYKATRNEKISRVVKKFTAAFQAYASLQYPESARIRHLTSVVEDAADLGIWLFEQPCGFDFIWDKAAVGKISISPAMVKVSDENGQHLHVEQEMVESTIVSYK